MIIIINDLNLSQFQEEIYNSDDNPNADIKNNTKYIKDQDHERKENNKKQRRKYNDINESKSPRFKKLFKKNKRCFIYRQKIRKQCI